MKQLFLTLAIAMIGYSSYAQTYLPLTAGISYPLTGVVVTNVSGNNQLALNNPSTNFGFISNPTTDVWSLGYGPTVTTLGTSVLNWNTSGNIGIGTTSPQSILDIGKNQSAPAFRIGNSAYGTSYNSIWGLRSGAESFMIFGNNGQNEIRAGNTNPGGYLDFYTNNTADYTSASDGNFIMRLASNGNVGVGTQSPAEKLNVSTTGSSPQFVISQSNWTSAGAHWYLQSVNGKLYIGNSTNTGGLYSSLSDRLIIDNTGNVGVGTSTPDAKLAVSGTIHAKEVKIDLTGWSDYVFKKTYHLPSLNEVKTYIDHNQHLPEMPSEQEVKDNGINLGEIVKVQTKKIEELTLYLIDKDKQVEKLLGEAKLQQVNNKQQDARIAVLEAALTKLTTNKIK